MPLTLHDFVETLARERRTVIDGDDDLIDTFLHRGLEAWDVPVLAQSEEHDWEFGVARQYY